MMTSSSLRMGIERTCGLLEVGFFFSEVLGRLYVVLGAELLGERGRHDDTADGGGGAEVRLPRLATRGREGWMLGGSLVTFPTMYP